MEEKTSTLKGCYFREVVSKLYWLRPTVRNAFYTVMQILMYNGDKGLKRNAYFTIETVGFSL